MAERLQVQGVDRRQYQRATLKTAVHMGSESNFYSGFSNDISEGGIFVATHCLMELGRAKGIEFSLPDDNEPVRVQGVVRWVREYLPGSDGTPGMGFQFIDLRPEDRQRIESFVKMRETLFYDD